MGHIQSQNSVHHFATVDKYFLKTQNEHGQWVNETKHVDQSTSNRDTFCTGTVLVI